MKKLVALTLIAVFALVGFATITAHAKVTDRFIGEVVDADTGNPVAGATVTYAPVDGGNSDTAITSAAGRFGVSPAEDHHDMYIVTITHPDYDTYQEVLSGSYLRALSRSFSIGATGAN